MTTEFQETLASALDKANPATLADILRKMRFGSMMSPVKVIVASLSAAAAIDITDEDTFDAATTVSGLPSLPNGADRTVLPAIGSVISLRVTTSGTANSVGSYVVGDASATAVTPTAGANVGLAKLSDDGTTLTFLTTVTGFELHYYPRPDVAMTENWPISD